MSERSSLPRMANDNYSIEIEESRHQERPEVRRYDRRWYEQIPCREKHHADKYGNPWPKYRNQAQMKLPPLVAVRHKCLDCCCEVSTEVKLCPVTTCPLWPFRFGKFPEDYKGPRSVLKPINLKCRDCAPEVIKGKPQWQTCARPCCPLWHLRFGKNPRRLGCGPKGGRPGNF